MSFDKNLVVGSTAQLSNYFPPSFDRVSSRSNLTSYIKEKWNTVYICFGENRTYLAHLNDSSITNQFYDINHRLTIDVVKMFSCVSRRVVVYSTAELWNDYSGPVDTDTPFKYKSNHYIQSKYNMTMELKDKQQYPNVSIAYPFNFNGVYRKGDFLFGKVFHSILTKTPIELGDTYYYRDILHPKWVVDESMIDRVGIDFVIGSGRLVFVNDLIRSLYESFGLDYCDFVTERIHSTATYRNRIFYSNVSAKNSNNEPISYTLVKELKEFKNGN